MKILPVSKAELIERLSSHRTLGDAPPGELEWLAEHGVLMEFEVGEVSSSPRLGPIDEMFIVLTGRIVIYLERTGIRKVMTWEAGDVTGMLPYSRLTVSPGDARIEEPAQIVTVHKDHFPELIRECPVVTTRLVWQMLDRARLFTTYDLHDEKMKSLGRFSAGLAHELDNPASAVIRSAKLLLPLLDEADQAARELGASGIGPDQYAAIENLRNGCLTVPVDHIRSAIEQARHEEAITDWLDDQDIDVDNVEALAESPLTVEMLDSLATAVDPEVLGAALQWVANGCAIRALAAELGEAATRMSHLVKAVKGFTQMDTAGTPAELDIGQGLTQTLAVLKSKARAKSVRVKIDTVPGLPPVRGMAGELNQVWANLIDNALDAVAAGGSVDVTARVEGDRVVVRVVDDGVGIPRPDLERIFEPFYTTKPVGSGTGLGLDIVRRLVNQNDGDIEVSSVPGRTEFRVTLPIAQPASEDLS